MYTFFIRYSCIIVLENSVAIQLDVLIFISMASVTMEKCKTKNEKIKTLIYYSFLRPFFLSLGKYTLDLKCKIA